LIAMEKGSTGLEKKTAINPMSGRTVEDEYFMAEALKEAGLAAAAGEVPIGAILALGDRIIARGHNRPIQAMDPTAHAEMEVLRHGALALGNYRIPGSRLYVTKEPCLMCAGAILHARVSELIAGTLDEKSGAIWSKTSILQAPWINHRIHARSGVLEVQCRSLLQEFFRQRRETQKKKKSSLPEDPSLENVIQV
jgi:tRNA(adenine34) deaminase